MDTAIHTHEHDGDKHGHHSHGDHTHGPIDPSISATERGLWAVKVAFWALLITALFQLAVVFLSGSIALFADTIHNFGDAATAVPLGLAFLLAKKKPSARFSYGLGGAEDLAGLAIVMLILGSAIVAGYESIYRILHPQPVNYLLALAAASVVGFIGNEAVAIFRIRIGKEINSVALIADGYHARTDGWGSLAVLFGAIGVWAGFPQADPLIGLGITFIIMRIVWQSGYVIFTRLLGGVEDTNLVEEIRHAAQHVEGVKQVMRVRARWLGRQLLAEINVVFNSSISVAQAEEISHEVKHQLSHHVAALDEQNITIQSVPEGTVSE